MEINKLILNVLKYIIDIRHTTSKESRIWNLRQETWT